MKRSVRTGLFLSVLGAAILSGCSYLVDEDRSDCGGSLRIDYRLRLVTNRQAELETVLPSEEDAPVRNALAAYLKGIFSDFAHDADLSFFGEDGERLEHLNEIMDADAFSCSLYLPAGTVRHTAAANVEYNGPVSLEDGILVQHADGTASDLHRTGLFAGRGTLTVLPVGDQQATADLYMVNAATALVLETKGAEGIGDIKAYVSGMADSFSPADSTWSFASSPLVRTEGIPVGTGTQQCLVSVHFPSRDYRPGTRTVTETVEPFLAEPAPEPLWSWRVYVPVSDGTVTETVLSLSTPLRAGQLKILKAKVYDTGIVSVSDPLVGVSVTLDWNQGQDHDIEI